MGSHRVITHPYLPEAQRPWVKATLTRAYTHTDVKAARRLLQDLARRLDVDYPSAAASIREGLDETLTVVELQLSERLRRSLATTTELLTPAVIEIRRYPFAAAERRDAFLPAEPIQHDPNLLFG